MPLEADAILVCVGRAPNVEGLGLGRLASVIHPYPTQAEAIRKVGDAFNRTRLTPGRARLLRRFFAWRR